MKNTEIQVIHNIEKQRFEIQIESHIAELKYLLNGDIIVFTHTGVPAALERRGIGSLLVKAGLEYAKHNNLKVQALCWFVNKYIQRHIEYQEMTVRD